MRFSAVLLALAACGTDVEVTRLPDSPTATRALAFLEDDTVVAIGGDSEFGLAYLQRHDGERWVRAEGVPGFDAHAKVLRGGSYVFAIGETQLHRWERPFTWTPVQIPIATTPDTAFGVDMLGHLFAVELQPDGAGAVWRWRTDTTRWEELAITRPIGIGAEHFTVAEDGNSVAWSVPGTGIVRVDLIAGTRTEVSCADPALGACEATIRDLVATRESVTALVCGQESDVRTVVQITDVARMIGDFHGDAACRALSRITYGTLMVVGDQIYILDPDDGLVPITDADPALTYVLRDPSTAFGFGDGVYRVDF